MKKLHFTFLVVSILLMGGCQLDFWESSGRIPKLDGTTSRLPKWDTCDE